MKFDNKGMKELQKQLSNIEKEINKQIGDKPLYEVLNDDFIRNNTKFNNLECFQNEMPKVDLTQYEYLNGVKHLELDNFIKTNTNFSSWNEMINKVYEKLLK